MWLLWRLIVGGPPASSDPEYEGVLTAEGSLLERRSVTDEGTAALGELFGVL